MEGYSRSTYSYNAHAAFLPTFKLPTSIAIFQEFFGFSHMTLTHVSGGLLERKTQDVAKEGSLHRTMGGENIVLGSAKAMSREAILAGSTISWGVKLKGGK